MPSGLSSKLKEKISHLKRRGTNGKADDQATAKISIGIESNRPASPSPKAVVSSSSLKFLPTVPDINSTPQRPDRPVTFGLGNFPHAVVKYKFAALQGDELAADKWQFLVLLRKVDASWYYACTPEMDKMGFIPKDFLEVLVDIPDQVCNTTTKQLKTAIELPEEYKKAADTCPSKSPPLPPKPIPTEKRAKMREPSDAFCRVRETYDADANEDLSAQAGEILICVDEKVENLKPLPQDWIRCMNFAGKIGLFPGNFAEHFDSTDELEKALKQLPHAVAITATVAVEEGFVPLEVGEAIYIDKIADGLIFGRTASGKLGKASLDKCTVVVPP